MNIESLRTRIQKLIDESRQNDSAVYIITIDENGTLFFNDGYHQSQYDDWEAAAEYIDKLRENANDELTLIFDDIPLRATNPQLAKKWDEFENKRIK
mgnify:FL=1